VFSARGKETPCALCEKPAVLDPENVLVWEMFNLHLASQARVGGMGGFLGFDYSVLPLLFQAYEIAPFEWSVYLEKIAILSRIAVKCWNTETKK
jgi:hypothetical protein